MTQSYKAIPDLKKHGDICRSDCASLQEGTAPRPILLLRLFSELDCMPGIYRLFTVPFSVPQLQLVMPTETTFGASQSASNQAGIQLIQTKPKLFQILIHISLRFGPTINTFKARKGQPTLALLLRRQVLLLQKDL